MSLITCAHMGCNRKPVVHTVQVADRRISGEQHFCVSHMQECWVLREYKDNYYINSGVVVLEDPPYQLCCLLFDDRCDGVNFFNAMLLKQIGGRHILCFGCGLLETTAAYYEIQNPPNLRLTHSLMREAIEALGGEVRAAVITELLSDKRFKAIVRIATGRSAYGVEVEARPSDAVVLAHVCQAHILVSSHVIKQLTERPWVE